MADEKEGTTVIGSQVGRRHPITQPEPSETLPSHDPELGSRI